MKTISVTCNTCGNSFEKPLKEYNRSERIGRKHYCSISCSSKRPEQIQHLKNIRNNDTSHLNPSNKLDEFSLFRQHLRRAKRRKYFCNLTLEEMKEVWDNQNGICIYSNVPLIPASYKEENNPIYTMSLDRINSNIGYIKSNIQFISIAMNHLKHKMTHEQMLEILQILKN